MMFVPQVYSHVYPNLHSAGLDDVVSLVEEVACVRDVLHLAASACPDALILY